MVTRWLCGGGAAADDDDETILPILQSMTSKAMIGQPPCLISATHYWMPKTVAAAKIWPRRW